MKINEKNLIAYSLLREHIDKEGYLLQKSEVTKTFQRRWFILKGNLLFYFEKKGDKEPIGVIILEGCTTELAESEEYYVFKLIFCGDGSKTFILAAESQELLESWMKYISRASYDYLKLMVAELQKQLEEIEEQDKNNDFAGSGVVSPVSLCTQHSFIGRQRENPFNKSEEDCTYSDLWISTESLHNAASLLSKVATVSEVGVLGVNSSLPPSVPFRPAPPLPLFCNSVKPKPSRKTFAELHHEFGVLILKDKQYYKEAKFLHKQNSLERSVCPENNAKNSSVKNLIDL